MKILLCNSRESGNPLLQMILDSCFHGNDIFNLTFETAPNIKNKTIKQGKLYVTFTLTFTFTF
jgi:hypothetical protein